MKDAQPSYISKPVIVCGDFNVVSSALDIKNFKSNLGKAGNTEEERQKFHQLLDSGFTDSFRHLHPDEEKYSWWSYRFKARERNAGWRLDYFLVSDDLKGKIIEAEIHDDVFGSDHCPISLKIDI